MLRPFFGAGPAGDILYTQIRDSPFEAEIRARIESMWREYAPVCGDDPGHFLNDARQHFFARVWEMSVASWLTRLGCALPRPPSGAPDHLVAHPLRVWIEDTIATPGTGADAARDFPPDGLPFTVDHDARLLRYCAAIRAKWDQLRKFRSRGIVGENDAFLIAVNGSPLPVADMDYEIPDIVRALFGLDDPVFVLKIGAKKAPRIHHAPRSNLQKRSGAQVAITFFASPAFAAISGVMFSPFAPWDLGGEQMNDRMEFIHNPFATAPVPRGTFRVAREWWVDRADDTLRRNEWS